MSLHSPDRQPAALSSKSDAALRRDSVGMNPHGGHKGTDGAVSRGLHFFSRLMKRFYAARDGNIAIMTALLMMPMIGVAGVAIDYAYAARNKGRLDSAATIAATAAAQTARNYLDITGPTLASRTNNDFETNYENMSDINARSEGERVGRASFTAQIGLLPSLTVTLSSVTVKRVGNTINATATYQASQATLLMSIFRFPSISYSGAGTMIISLQDTKTNDVTIDEGWSAEVPASRYSLATVSTSPVIKDWYPPAGSATIQIGAPPPDDAEFDTTLNTAAATQARVGRSSLLIGSGGAAGISKKIYLDVGDYELSYWYKSAVIYNAYEPVYICGSDAREWDWVTNTDWRNSTGSGSGTLVSAAKVYLDPVLSNPQYSSIPPMVFNDSNLIDGCAYSGRWVQRLASFRVNNAGYYWLSFIAPQPTLGTSQGFHLGPVRLCAQVRCAGTPYNNSPWKSQPKLLSSDSFETTNRVVDGSTFDLSTPFGSTASLYKSVVANWNTRTFSITTSTNAAGVVTTTGSLTMPITWTPSSPTAPIVYHRGTAATGVNNVELKSPNTSLSRTLLLMPGVYDLKLYAKSPPQPPSNSCAITDQKNYYTMNYFRTDHPNTPSYGNPAPTALLGTSDTVENDILTKAMNYTCNPYNVFSSASEQHLCFLVPRTGFWDVGVYSRDSGAVHVDEISVTLLTSNITNTDTWPVMDPTTWDPRKTPGPQAALASNPKCNNRISIVLGGVVGWPSYTTFSRASGRITVTQSKYL